eukprot:9932968-Alexandrium_andersonii.AAC.1
MAAAPPAPSAPGGEEPGGDAAESSSAGPPAAAGSRAADGEAAWRDWHNWICFAQDAEILICLASAHWTCRRCNVVGRLVNPPGEHFDSSEHQRQVRRAQGVWTPPRGPPEPPPPSSGAGPGG